MWWKMSDKNNKNDFLPDKPLQDLHFVELKQIVRAAGHQDNEKAREAIELVLSEMDRRDCQVRDRDFKISENLHELDDLVDMAKRRMREIQEIWCGPWRENDA